MKNTITAFLLSTLLLCFGCTDNVDTEKPETEAVLKIAIQLDGTILANGNQTDLASLSERMKETKEKEGMVWFYRANPTGEPPPNSMEVLKMIIDAELPISLFTKEDFSEILGEDGTPKKLN
jgi:hypothetical protein